MFLASPPALSLDAVLGRCPDLSRETLPVPTLAGRLASLTHGDESFEGIGMKSGQYQFERILASLGTISYYEWKNVPHILLDISFTMKLV